MHDLKFHLEWRQTNIPMPILTDRTVHLLRQGFLYIHGRAKDMSPIVMMDIIKLQELLDKKQIDPPTFCQLQAFVSHYLHHNMLLPGQQEKWIVIMNLNKFSVSNLPVGLFKASHREINHNYVECN